MYSKSDPRASLSPQKNENPSIEHTSFFGSQIADFHGTPPQIETETEKTWIVRGQNMIVAYSELSDGCIMSRAEQPDEYAVLLPDDTLSLSITADEAVTVPGYSIAFVPPGRSDIRTTGSGRLIRLFSPNTADIANMASNTAEFQGEHPNVPPFVAWPEPKDGFKIRHYSLDIPTQPGRFGRIFCCTTFMINYLDLRMGPRARTAVSPHHHDDFEQCSLALSGRFTHHLRWPWTTDMTKWKEDEHLEVGSPSVCIIPPPSIHTSTAEDAGENQLVDIFAPPRLDFIQKDGWVLNADDYPMPE